MSLVIDTSMRSPNFSDRTAPILGILIHATAAGGTSSLGHLCNPAPVNAKTGQPDPDLAVSAHYLIKKSGYIHQLVDEECHVAWHAGKGSISGMPEYTNKGNEVLVGIELENLNDGKDPYPPAQVQAAVDLCRLIISKHPDAKNLLLRHRDYAPRRKSDPEGLDWSSFVSSVLSDNHVTYWSTARVLHLRNSPSLSAQIIGELGFHQTVTIVAQVVGDTVIDTPYWGRTAAGEYVSMRYLASPL